MTLHAIVAALGGDLYCGGRRANIPAPGHSATDRSVSLLLSGDRLVIHCFGEADWRSVRACLEARGLVGRTGRITSTPRSVPGQAAPRPDRPTRIAAARRLWDGAIPIGPASLSGRHLATRAIRQDPWAIAALRHHPAAPVAAYRCGGATQPALVAAITAPGGALTAVELTYLTRAGRRDDRLWAPRKTVGAVPPGSAVRLAPASPALVVGEGVMTALSASDRFGLPAWALLSAHNLSAWPPPPGVRRVIIAADRGRAGAAAAARLAARLMSAGVGVTVRLPPAAAEDWNAFAMAERLEEGG